MSDQSDQSLWDVSQYKDWTCRSTRGHWQHLSHAKHSVFLFQLVRSLTLSAYVAGLDSRLVLAGYMLILPFRELRGAGAALSMTGNLAVMLMPIIRIPRVWLDQSFDEYFDLDLRTFWVPLIKRAIHIVIGYPSFSYLASYHLFQSVPTRNHTIRRCRREWSLDEPDQK